MCALLLGRGSPAVRAQSLDFRLLHGLAALGVYYSAQSSRECPSLSEIGHFCKKQLRCHQGHASQRHLWGESAASMTSEPKGKMGCTC